MRLVSAELPIFIPPPAYPVRNSPALNERSYNESIDAYST